MGLRKLKDSLKQKPKENPQKNPKEELPMPKLKEKPKEEKPKELPKEPQPKLVYCFRLPFHGRCLPFRWTSVSKCPPMFLSLESSCPNKAPTRRVLLPPSCLDDFVMCPVPLKMYGS
ncbi:hypothetical protein ACOMHN_029020 [Nucella lapillus]